MGYKLNFETVNSLFNELKKEYKIYAPKRFAKAGRYSDTDIIRYAEINNVEEIVWDEKSDYSAKEVVTPITQTLFYFTEDEYRESKIHDKKILIFARPCDINAQQNQDKIFLENGFEDTFYKRMREKVSYVLMECTTGWDTCFCCSMGSNKTDNYALAAKCEDGNVLFNVKDEAFAPLFQGKEETTYDVAFIEKNEVSVTIPTIPNKEVLNELKKHEMWNEYNKRCVGCGSCTIACSTCTCFTTTDIMYNENANIGERRRTSSSCQVKGFDEMAGGHDFRHTMADRYRYKTLHKIHSYNEAFGQGHMCVGCGRCTSRCPEFISFTATIEKVGKAVEEICGGKENA
ncbi:MAG: anaerobic sulfite reductase subunit AsrA [Cellulosilyticaceae bacterium]